MKLPLFNQRTIYGGEGCVFNPITGYFEIKCFPVPRRETQVWGMYPWKCGTKENPTIIEWKARVSNPSDDKAVYLGGAERYIRDGFWGIFVVHRPDQPPTFCFRTGVGRDTVKRIPLSFDTSVLHTYKIEWADEPRATLYVDGKTMCEHRESVPVCNLYPIVEIANLQYPKYVSILEWSPSLFMTNTILG